LDDVQQLSSLRATNHAAWKPRLAIVPTEQRCANTADADGKRSVQFPHNLRG